MGKNKALNELTDEELNKLAESGNDVEQKTSEYNPDVLNFILAFNLKPGRKLVHKGALYKLYKTWSSSPVFKITYTTEMRMHFQEKNTRYWYMSADSRMLRSKTFAIIGAKKKRVAGIYNGNNLKHFDAFIKHYDIKPGSYPIESQVLFRLYQRWCYMTKRKQHLIHRECVKFFNNKDFQWKRSNLNPSTKYFKIFFVNDVVLKEFGEKGIRDVEEAWKKNKQTLGNKKSSFKQAGYFKIKSRPN